jgi:hemoglobin
MKTKPVMRTGFFALTIFLAACATSTPTSTSVPAPGPAAATDPSLYQRLGGQEAITAVVEDFVGNVAADTRINSYFGKVDIPRLKEKLAEQICEGTGGPCKYTGMDMKTTHATLGITSADFDALVEDLIKTLDKFKVPQREKDELLGILGPMKSDIVTEGHTHSH